MIELSELTLAEELLLLMLDDRTGKDFNQGSSDKVGTALLVELVARGCVDEQPGTPPAGHSAANDFHVPPEYLPRECDTPPERLLAEALQIMRSAQEPQTAQTWRETFEREFRSLSRGRLIGGQVWRRVAELLVDRGVLEQRGHKLIGRASISFTEQDPAPKRDVLARVDRVLREGAEPQDPRTRLLLAFVSKLSLGSDFYLGRADREEQVAEEICQRAIRERLPGATVLMVYASSGRWDDSGGAGYGYVNIT